MLNFKNCHALLNEEYTKMTRQAQNFEQWKMWKMFEKEIWLMAIPISSVHKTCCSDAASQAGIQMGE